MSATTLNTTTDSDRPGAPRHRHNSNPVRATKAVLRSYRRAIAYRRQATKETQR